MRPLRFRPEAEADIAEACAWYDAQQPGLGADFEADVDHILCLIRLYPRMYPLVKRNTRRALLGKFPYLLFYRVLNDEILVVACIHPKRDPKHWPK